MPLQDIADIVKSKKARVASLYEVIKSCNVMGNDEIIGCGAIWVDVGVHTIPRFSGTYRRNQDGSLTRVSRKAFDLLTTYERVQYSSPSSPPHTHFLPVSLYYDYDEYRLVTGFEGIKSKARVALVEAIESPGFILNDIALRRSSHLRS